MSEELAVRGGDIENIFLAARNRDEMVSAKEKLTEWLDMKLTACRRETNELSTAFDRAIKQKWASSALKSALNASQRREVYYEKLRAASAAGYTMIPSFWYDCFAIRVKRKSATQTTTSSAYSSPDAPGQKSDRPALGEGRYVSEQSEGVQWQETETDKQGKEITRNFTQATDFMDVEFPLIAAKPELMGATAEAMALKCFDEIGVAPARQGKDPIIVGVIKGPANKQANFLIAWYLDTRSL